MMGKNNTTQQLEGSEKGTKLRKTGRAAYASEEKTGDRRKRSRTFREENVDGPGGVEIHCGGK